ncbi:MAG: chemotaxis response regulator protein-glutamate methylesterase [Opitutales bacterium]|nr:chemotaxis response regulator protein-glutamate methylesterase [Opitutales bacterium]
MSEKPIRVMIVDDSPTVRRALTNVFGKDREIQVVDTAVDPYDAEEKIMTRDPEVLTLDLEMPRMDGLTFLKIIMRKRPMPVIILSTLTNSGSAMAMEALRSGAFDVFGKPETAAELKEAAIQLCMKVKEAGWARRHKTWQHRIETNKTATPFRVQSSNKTRSRLSWSREPHLTEKHLILLGASTGGTEALSRILRKLPPHMPPVLVSQHIPARFSLTFAQRLDGECALTAKEAEDGEYARQGCIYIAPGGYHLTAKFAGGRYRLSLNEEDPVWHQRPAVDVMFESLIHASGPHIVAGLLTGMGKDGAHGLLKLKEAGCRTFAEDEKTCVVYGMPRVAKEIGAPEKMIPIQDMAQAVLSALEESWGRCGRRITQAPMARRTDEQAIQPTPS